MSARDELDQIRQRAEDAARNREMYGTASRSRRITQEASAEDVPRLVAFALGVLDLADQWDDEDPAGWQSIHRTADSAIRAAAYSITADIRTLAAQHLTTKEGDR